MPQQKFKNRHVDAHLLAELCTTNMIVNIPPGPDDYDDECRLMDVGVISKGGNKGPEGSNLGMRGITATDGYWSSSASNNTAKNLSPAEVAELVNNDYHGEVYVPFGMVQAALESDSLEELTERDY